MFRLIAGSLLALAAFQVQASALMDVSPGDTLTRVQQAYPHQFFYQQDGQVTMLDMHDRYPAFVFLDVGALDTVVGTAWLSVGSTSGQAALFKGLEKRYADKGVSALREDEITSCSAMPGGRAYQVRTSMRMLSDGSTLLLNQAPTFSAVSVTRGSAQRPDFQLPDFAGKADELDKHRDALNAYQKAWNVAFRTQLTGALNGLPNITFCPATLSQAQLEQPIALGKPLASGLNSQDLGRVPVEYALGPVTFHQAAVTVASNLVERVQYSLSGATLTDFEAARDKISTVLGAPSVSDTSKEAGRTTQRVAWSDAAFKHLTVSLQYIEASPEKPGQLQLSLQRNPA